MNPFRYSIGSRTRGSYFLRLLKLHRPDKVVDLGCGIGYFADLFSEQDTSVFGIDTEPKAIFYTKKNVRGRFCVTDINNIPFKDESFDTIVCSEVLEHIKDDKCVLGKIYRISKDSAMVIVTAPCTEGVFGPTIKRIAHGSGSEMHVKEGYKASELRDKIESARIEVISIEYTMVFFVELFMGLTKLIYLLLYGKYRTQSDILKVGSNKFILPSMFLFPLYSLLEYIDKLLIPFLKGHDCVVYGTVKKKQLYH